MNEKNLSGLMRKRLPAKVCRLLKTIGSEGEKAGVPVYLVGGMVRDLLSGAGQDFDIDIVTEGDGVKFARRLQKLLGGKLVAHSRFGTATIFSRQYGRLDVATARQEVYPSAAALPEVSPSAIEYDLYRRDFSINSMAIRLDGRGFGQLHDPFNGQGDLRRGIVRSLYELSFVDDPTRIFRAVRFRGRFGFRLHAATASQIRRTLALIEKGEIPLARIGDELLNVLKEKDPRRALKQLEKLGALRLVHPALGYGAAEGVVVGRVLKLAGGGARSGQGRAVALFLALAGSMAKKELGALLKGLRYRGSFSRAVIAGKAGKRRALAGLGVRQLSASGLAGLLDGLSEGALIYYMAAGKDARATRRVLRYLSCLREAKPACSGRDLIKMGLKPGPLYNRIFKELRSKRLDGELGSKREELEYVKGKYL